MEEEKSISWGSWWIVTSEELDTVLYKNYKNKLSKWELGCWLNTFI